MVYLFAIRWIYQFLFDVVRHIPSDLTENSSHRSLLTATLHLLVYMCACIALFLSIIDAVASPMCFYFFFRISNTGAAQRIQTEVHGVHVQVDRSGPRYRVCGDSCSLGTWGILVQSSALLSQKLLSTTR